MGGRIDAIGLSVVMPEGPRRIPGRLSVARAPPAVRKLSGTYIECLHLSDSGRRVSLVPAQCSSHALCDRATVSLFLRTPDCGLGASSEKAENSTTSATICPATIPTTFTGKPPIAGPWHSCRARTARFLGPGPRSGCAGGGLCLRKVCRASRSLPEGRSDAHSRADDLAQ